MAKAMTLPEIEALTKDFAEARTEMMTIGERLNTELQAVRDKHAKELRDAAKKTNQKAEVLFDAVDSNRALFTAKAKSKVWCGIKVGLQKGKASIATVDGTTLDAEKLYDAIGNSESLGYDVVDAYVDVTYTAKKASLLTLAPDQLAGIGLRRITGKDCVLVKPVDGDAAKIVDALIKEFVAED